MQQQKTLQQRKPRRQREKGQGTSPIVLHPRLSQCSQAYAKALTDPFGPTEEPPCIPDTVTLPSWKFSTTSRGVFQIGTAGFGYVTYDPWLAVHSGATVAGAYTNAPVRFTQAAFTGFAFDPATIPSGTAVNQSNSSITVAQMQDALSTREYRLVGAGVRVRYTGTELNRGGRMVVYRNRANQPSVGFNTIASVLRDNFYTTREITREWSTVTYAPSRSADTTYGKYIDPITTTTVGFPIFMALVESTSANTFEYECISHFEMIGGSVGLPISPSHSDPQGMGAITASLPDRYVNAGLGLFKAVAANAANYLVEQVSSVLPMEGKILLQASKALPWDGPKVEEVLEHEDL